MPLRPIRSPWDRPGKVKLHGYVWGHNVYKASGVADQTEGFATGSYSKTFTVWTAAFYLASSAPTSLPAGITTYHFTASYLPYNSPTGYAGDYSIAVATGLTFPAASNFVGNNIAASKVPFSGQHRLSNLFETATPTKTHLVQPSGYAATGLVVAYHLLATGAQRHEVYPGAKVADYSYRLVKTGMKLAASGQRMPTAQSTFTATMLLNADSRMLTQVYQPATQWLAVRHYRLRPVVTNELWYGSYKHAGSPSTIGQSLHGYPTVDFTNQILWRNNRKVTWSAS